MHHAICHAGGSRWRFTLIELLVVVAIIAVLAAMLLPALGKARSMAVRSSCLNQVRQYGMAALSYADEWDSQLPPMFYTNTANSPTQFVPDFLTYNLLVQLQRHGLVYEQLSCPATGVRPRLKSELSWAVGNQMWWYAEIANGNYYYFGNPAAAGTKNTAAVWAKPKLIPVRNTDESADLKVLVSDRLVAQPDAYGYASGTYVTNHNPPGNRNGAPGERLAGVNQFMLDGHGAWKDGRQFPGLLSNLSPASGGTCQLLGTTSPNNFGYYW